MKLTDLKLTDAEYQIVIELIPTVFLMAIIKWMWHKHKNDFHYELAVEAISLYKFTLGHFIRRSK